MHRAPVEIAGLPPVYVDLRAGYSHWLLEHSPHAGIPNETDEEKVVRRIVRAGDAVFDIGANIGWYTVLLSQLVGTEGTVHSFEPNAALLPNLKFTVANLPNATLHAVALSDEQGDATFYVPEDHQTASLADWTHGRVGATREITCRQ